MSRKEENKQFICAQCGQDVMALKNGGYRNHCPFCLGSVHVDNKPGDRKNACNGLMIACRLKQHKKKGWQIIHCCQQCGVEKANKIAEDCDQPDDWEKIILLDHDP